MRFVSLLILVLSTHGLLQAQAPEKPDLPPTQLGVRANWGLEFISKNTINGQEFALLETGQHIGFGGFLNIAAEENVQFSPFLGMDYTFFPKSTNYVGGCETDTFPTFWSVTDSVPGRDHRFWSVVLEPSFKFYVSKLKIHVRVFPQLSYIVRSRVENYSNSCGNSVPQSWLDYEEDPLRKSSTFNVALGGSIVKEVKVSENAFLHLETGYKFMMSQLLKVRDPDPDREGYSLYPHGWFLNLGFFR